MGTLMMVLWWKSTALATSAHYWMVAPGSTPSISTASIASRALSHTSLYRLLRQHRCWLSHVHHMDNSHIPKDSLYSHLALCKNSKLHIAIVPAHMPALKTIFCQLFKVNEDISPMFPSKASWQWKLVSLPFFLHIIRSSSSHKRDNIRTVIWWLLWPHHYRQNTSC